MRATSLGHAGILIRCAQASIVCDPWFVPAFLGSWFPFPRNDQLAPDVMAQVCAPDYLYVSHLHGDHFDEPFLRERMSKSATVLLPEFPTSELRRRLTRLGFTDFIETRDGEEIELRDGLRVAIHVESSVTDGPGGDSAIVVSDGTARLVNQNDCRTHDPRALAAHGPVDQHWLQYSGAIWYPMVYDETPERMRELIDLKVESQFSRAMRYVEALDARAVVPSAGPPCFLDPDLFGFNVIRGDELSIFPDQREFLRRLADASRAGLMNIPGTTFDIGDDIVTTHPIPENEVRAIFDNKLDYLREYQRDYLPWLDEMKSAWHQPTDDLVDTIRLWWEPLLAMAPTLRTGIGAACLLRAGDLEILIDFPNGRVRPYSGEPYGFRFEIDRRLVETVVAQNAVDWSDKLFLSCRFRAWRAGNYNEFIYNFFKSLSVERMARTEAEAKRKLAPPPPSEEIRIGDYIVERYCPHRQADLAVFGECEGDQLVCTLHGWKFDLATGRCLTAEDRSLRVRRASADE